MRKREDLRGVGERHWALARGVPSSEEIDEKGDKSKVSFASFRYQVAKTCSQQSPGHLWESEEQKSSTPKCVDGPDSWPSEDEVDESKAHRSEERFGNTGARLLEDRARVKGDDVY